MQMIKRFQRRLWLSVPFSFFSNEGPKEKKKMQQQMSCLIREKNLSSPLHSQVTTSTEHTVNSLQTNVIKVSKLLEIIIALNKGYNHIE